MLSSNSIEVADSVFFGTFTKAQLTCDITTLQYYRASGNGKARGGTFILFVHVRMLASQEYLIEESI